MSKDLMREKFEAWASVEFSVDAELLATSRTDEDMYNGFPYRILNKHGEDSELANTLVGTAWVGWQAALASVEVELPETPNRGIGYALFDAGKEACREAIEAAGLKVKA